MNPRKAFLSVLAVLALVAVHFSQARLNVDRQTLGLTQAGVLSNAPPVLAFTTVALGGFRGIIANALWIRSSELQDDGKHFEAVQLADWITKLQPHFSAVWVHLAWNLSYNISVKFPDPEDRWLWVQRGIELLRDEGLKYNPHAIDIHAELARQFHHKMGANLDDAHLTYKAHWAEEMHRALGGGRPDFAELLHPSTPEAKARVATLVGKYKLDPALMKKVDETYGPLEWRLPETHAIYWAMRGLAEGRGAGDLRMLRRAIFQPMQMAFHRGRLVTNQFSQKIEFAPNLAMIPNASKAYLDQMAAEEEEGMRESFGNAHKNFIRDAVYFLYTYNRMAEARKWFAYVQKTYAADPNVTKWTSVEDYALSRLIEDVNETSRDRVRAFLEGSVESAFMSLVEGDPDRFQGLMLFAEKVRSNFVDRTQNKSSQQRVPLPEMADIKREALLRMLSPQSPFPPEFQGRLRTEMRLPTDWGKPTGTNNAAPPVNIGAPKG
ncbi:MAG: hypothetical protein DVB31_04275 [Verrucomicrobia bacterium]|nr:MAG: hypothetical protein DVB31_04275 [Verrucomicrobiota bacterium]